MSKLYLKRISKTAQLPEKATDHAACYDIRANINGRELSSFIGNDLYELEVSEQHDIGLIIHPNQRVLIPTGWKMCCDPGWKIEVSPRSGKSIKEGLSLINCTGIIDADYRNELMILVVNHNTVPVTIKHGERIAQLSLERVNHVDLSCSSDEFIWERSC